MTVIKVGSSVSTIRVCEFDGCSNTYIYTKNNKYCEEHTRLLRKRKYQKPKPKPIITSVKMSGKSLKAKKDRESIHKQKVKSIKLRESPNIDTLLRFKLDDKTIVYCKTEEQLEKFKERVYRIYPWKRTIIEE